MFASLMFHVKRPQSECNGKVCFPIAEVQELAPKGQHIRGWLRGEFHQIPF